MHFFYNLKYILGSHSIQFCNLCSSAQSDKINIIILNVRDEDFTTGGCYYYFFSFFLLYKSWIVFILILNFWLTFLCSLIFFPLGFMLMHIYTLWISTHAYGYVWSIAVATVSAVHNFLSLIPLCLYEYKFLECCVVSICHLSCVLLETLVYVEKAWGSN